MRRMLTAATMAALICTACSSDSDDGEDGESSTSSGTLTFADLDATEWHRGTDPDRLLSAFGSIWVKFADGKVQRTDPADGKVIASIPTGYDGPPSCDLLGADESHVWTCAGPNSLLPIDPRSNTAGKPVHGSILSDQIFLPWSGGMLWTIRGDGKTLDGRSSDGSVATSVDLKAFCTDLAGSETVLIALCPTDTRVVFIDPRQAKVVGHVRLEDPRRGAVADSAWVGYEGGTAQIDPKTLEVMAKYDVVPELEGAVWASDTDVWVRTAGGEPFLTHIDPTTQEIVETVDAPQFTSGGDVLELGDDLWVTAYDDQLVATMSAR